MRKTIFVIFLVFGLFLLFSRVNSQINSQSNNSLIYLAEVDSEIKSGTLQYLKRTVKEAEKEKAEYLVIKLDTPGGLLKATKDIVDLLLETKIKTIVFVHKEGGWAYSAGTFILLSADYAVVHPQASIGAAQPREIFINEVKEIDPKIVEGMTSWVKSLAEANQKNPEIAEKFVRENLTLTGKEAKELKVINETARDLDELFLKLKIQGPEIKTIQPTFFEKFFDFLSHPYLISLFLTLGGLGLIFAFRTGEFEITGVLGLILLFIGLWGIGVVNFSFLGAGLLLLGLLLLIIEIFAEPGFGVLGIFGVLAILLGIFTFESEPFLTPKFFDPITMVVIGAVLAVFVLFIIIGRGVVKIFKTKPKTGSEALISLTAEVTEELNPRGRVKVKEESWLAESMNKETIKKGEKVEIVKLEGNTLFVEKQLKRGQPPKSRAEKP